MAQWSIKEIVDLARSGEPKREARPYDLMLPGNNEAHVWEIEVLDNGEAVDLSSVTQVLGSFVRQRDPDSRVDIVGSASGNVVSVKLKTECYAYAGSLRGIMEITTSTGEIVTLSEKYFNVKEPKPGQIVDPGQAFPDIEEQARMLEEVQQEVSAIDLRVDDLENQSVLEAELTLESPWQTWTATPTETLRVMRKGGIVFLQGIIAPKSDMTLSSNSKVCDLPTWAYPARLADILNQGGSHGTFLIVARPDGYIDASRYNVGGSNVEMSANTMMCMTGCWLAADAAGATVDDLEALIARMEAVAAGSVRYDGAQVLTTAQKAQARTNIGAAATETLISGEDYELTIP